MYSGARKKVKTWYLCATGIDDLQVIPNDPDGLHLLGLVRHSQGKLLRGTSEGGADEETNRKAPSVVGPSPGKQKMTPPLPPVCSETYRFHSV